MVKTDNRRNYLPDRVWEAVKLLEQLKVQEERPLECFHCRECGYQKPEELPEQFLDWPVFGQQDRWGAQPDTHMWFCAEVEIPEAEPGTVWELSITTGREGGWDSVNPQFTCYLDGELFQGMDINHTSVRLDCGGRHRIILYAYSGMEPGSMQFLPALRNICLNTERLYYHLLVPLEALGYQDEYDGEFIRAVQTLNQAVNLLDFRVPHSPEYRQSVEAAVSFLEDALYTRDQQPGSSVVCIGHTHIDIAWMWPVRQTREKAVRSFATVVRLMRRYPDYRFLSSQPLLYQFVKEEAPALYEEIRALVRQGRWEPEGAMWVEADCNLPGGESLVRQLVYGKRFFQEEFGVDSHILWLPDVFGYSAALPQILRKAGVDTFVTSKISWSETNVIPNDMFWWQGIDGTELFTYFLTGQERQNGKEPHRFTMYNGILNPAYLAGTWERFQNKELSGEVLLTFGYGDGGGGATADMLEQEARLRGGLPGCPAAQCGFAGPFLDRMRGTLENCAHPPKWVGELYLELHRGTYTSMAEVKRENRKNEYAYQRAEWLSSMGQVLCGLPYPKRELDEGWITLLTNQFHDIIPGSSIGEVYDLCREQYQETGERAGQITRQAMMRLAARVKTGGGLLVFNPHGFENSGVVDTDEGKVYVRKVPPKGYRVVQAGPPQGTAVCYDGKSLENRFFRLEWNEQCQITRLYDKQHRREMVPPGARANVLQAFEDYPRHWDAWEISDYYTEKMWEVDRVVSSRFIDDGVRGGLAVEWQFLESTIRQTIWLYDDMDRIDFQTGADWNQKHILLKAAFPVDICASEATYDIQFGNVRRPTHANTPWDAAKFEVCAHKFADLSEEGYGVSLMNDCKYGYDIRGNVMRLTLLKSSTYPNPEADQGKHRFTYALWCHEGTARQPETYQTALDLNLPMEAVPVPAQEGDLPEQFSLAAVDAPNVMIDTVKQAEDGRGMVIRLFECCGRRVQTRAAFGFALEKAWVCSLLEEEEQELAVTDGGVLVTVKPFEIITLKVQ